MTSETTEDFNQIYPWISEGFFEGLLRHGDDDESITVTGYSLKPALAKGENFASQMIRAKVSYDCAVQSGKEISLIVKAAITTSPEMTQLTEELGLFRKEIAAYLNIIPEVVKLLQSIGDNSKLTAKCYDANLELSYLVFEDLSVSGYANVDRKIGLDVDHFQHVLAKAAKWHAATAVLINRNGLPKECQASHMTTDSLKILTINTVSAMADVVTEWPGYAHLSPKLKKLGTTIYDKVLNSTTVDQKNFNAMCHGDMWSNNIMFRHDELNTVVDAILIDFQVNFWGSSVLDIIYTLLTSSNQNLREHDWDDLVVYYHEELVRVLEQLKYAGRIPSLADIQADRLKRGIYSAIMGMMGLALRNVDSGGDDEVTKFMRDTEEDHLFRVKTFMNPKIRDGLEFLVGYFDKSGYFD